MIERIVSTTRGDLGVRTVGDPHGATVVALHGFPDDATTFDELARTLADAGLRVTSVYLRGYDPSPRGGSLQLDALVEDLYAVVAELSPNRPVYFVGHDYGAQLGYPALARAPQRFAAAVLLAGAHPTLVARNGRRSLRQLWLSRYILFFQLGRVADREVARRDFAYVDRLWRRWSPGLRMPAEHRAHVKHTLARSMPAPVAMYRGGDFDVAPDQISVATLYIGGADDGCALPMLTDGQAALFSGDYRQEVWPGTGHYPHLEQPKRCAAAVLDWISAHPLDAAPGADDDQRTP